MTKEQEHVLKYIREMPLPGSFCIYDVTPNLTIYTEEERTLWVKRITKAWSSAHDRAPSVADSHS